MSSSRVRALSALAKDIRFADDRLCVLLKDGREIDVPLEWFPRLRDASADERSDWRLIGDGVGIHWPRIDEDVSVEALLRV